MNALTQPASPAALARFATVRPPEIRSPSQIKRELRFSRKARKTKLALVPMKQFCTEEAEHDGVNPHTIWQRINRGHYRDCLRFKHINARVILVLDTRTKT